MANGKSLQKKLRKQKAKLKYEPSQALNNMHKRISKSKYYIPIGLCILILARFIFTKVTPYQTLVILNKCEQANQIDTEKYQIVLPAYCQSVQNAHYWVSDTYDYSSFVPCATSQKQMRCDLFQVSKAAYVTFNDLMQESKTVKAVVYNPRMSVKKLLRKQIVKASGKLFIQSNILYSPAKSLSNLTSSNYTPLIYNMFITSYDVNTDFINTVTSLNVKNLCNQQQKVNIFYNNLTQEQLEAVLSYGPSECLTVEEFNLMDMCRGLQCMNYIQVLLNNRNSTNQYHLQMLSNYLIQYHYGGFLIQPNALINPHIVGQEIVNDTIFLASGYNQIYAFHHGYMYFKKKHNLFISEVIKNFKDFYNIGCLHCTGTDLLKFVYVHMNNNVFIGASEVIQPSEIKNSNVNSLFLKGKLDNSVLDYYSTSHKYYAINFNKVRTINQPFCHEHNLLYSVLTEQIMKSKVCQKENEAQKQTE